MKAADRSPVPGDVPRIDGARSTRAGAERSIASLPRRRHATVRSEETRMNDDDNSTIPDPDLPAFLHVAEAILECEDYGRWVG